MNLAGSIAIGASSENFGHSCLPSPRFAQTSNRSIKKGLYDCIFVRLRLSRAGFERTKTFVDKHICTSNPSFTAVAGEQSRRLEQPNSLASFIARIPLLKAAFSRPKHLMPASINLAIVADSFRGIRDGWHQRGYGFKNNLSGSL